jgi:hypothetical protein
MTLTTALVAAVAAVMAGPAAADGVDEGWDSGHAPATVTAPPTIQPGMVPYLSHGVGVDETQFSGEPSVGVTGASAVAVERAVAAADEAYDAYRERTAIAARQALFADEQHPVGLAGDSAPTRARDAIAPTGASAGDGVDWSSFGLGAGMTALLAAAVAGVALTTRRRGGVALP